MKLRKITTLVFLIMFLVSCKEKGRFLQSITGSPYEILVVIDHKTWDSDAGKIIYDLLESDIPGLPQREPCFSVSHCSTQEFTSLLKPTRNLLFVEVDDKKYSKAKVTYSVDKWASSQALVKIVAPDQESFEKLIKNTGDHILTYLIDAELKRMKTYLGEHTNTQLMKLIQNDFNVSMVIPHYIVQYKKGENMLWMSTGVRDIRQDIFIYSYPYTDQKMLTKEALLNKRDSVNKIFVPGPEEGSYVGTEYKYDDPVFKEKWMDDRYCAEIRGLWKVKDGGVMGGPFISHTRIDELHQRVITIEAFVYAPSKKKRNAIRQLESVLYSVKVPTVIDDVVVTAE